MMDRIGGEREKSQRWDGNAYCQATTTYHHHHYYHYHYQHQHVGSTCQEYGIPEYFVFQSVGNDTAQASTVHSGHNRHLLLSGKIHSHTVTDLVEEGMK